MRLDCDTPDPSIEPMSFDGYLATLAKPLEPRLLRAFRTMARTVDWGGLAPTRTAWCMLELVALAALEAEGFRHGRERRRKQGVRLEIVAPSGCKVYRVAAWERPTPKRSKRKAKP